MTPEDGFLPHRTAPTILGVSSLLEQSHEGRGYKSQTENPHSDEILNVVGYAKVGTASIRLYRRWLAPRLRRCRYRRYDNPDGDEDDR